MPTGAAVTGPWPQLSLLLLLIAASCRNADGSLLEATADSSSEPNATTSEPATADTDPADAGLQDPGSSTSSAGSDAAAAPDAPANASNGSDASFDEFAPRPDAASPAEPDAGADAGPVCGDGKTEGDELCDTSCPLEVTCAVVDACLVATYSGSPETCDARCEVSERSACEDGDGCCPAGCDRSQDDDCSPSCGDGIVDTGSGESCEPGSSSDPCPSSCDDGVACTGDVMSGSEENCNVRCSHPAITEAIDSDGCCLAGENANTDNDCAPQCGNDVVEPGEQCEGGANCDADCQLDEVGLCKSLRDSSSCDQCLCTSCVSEVLACQNTGNAADDAKCDAVVDCGVANSCSGIDCYCGAASALACATAPAGACIAEIETAAGSDSPVTIVSLFMSTDNPVGRAAAVGSCSQTSCATPCGL